MANSNLAQSNTANKSPFDSIRHIDENGNEYWMARELMTVLSYKLWQRFNEVIETAQENVETVTASISEHFLSLEIKNNGRGRPKRDYKLSRLACYHIALSCDSRGNEQVKHAKHYFAVKTREAEVKTTTPTQQQLPPKRDSIDFIEAADKLCKLSVNGQLKQLLEDAMVDDLSLAKTNDNALTASQKEYTIVKVRAKELGYSIKEINAGTGLGRYVAGRVDYSFKKRVGDYQVKHYAVTDDLDQTIHAYFGHK